MGIGIIMLLTEIFRQHVVRTYNPFVVTTLNGKLSTTIHPLPQLQKTYQRV
jgi:hypothetical protein